MIKRLIKWLRGREQDYNKQEKARLCAPCTTPCGEDLCKKIGCLNMDMRTNSLRLRLLIDRLEDCGYEFNIGDKVSPTTNVVQMKDYRKDD